MLNKKCKIHKDDEDVNDNIEVWQDLVNMRDLFLSLAVCSLTALGGYFIAPNQPPKPLFYGMLGAIAGFVISSMIVKPKRSFHEGHRGE